MVDCEENYKFDLGGKGLRAKWLKGTQNASYTRDVTFIISFRC